MFLGDRNGLSPHACEAPRLVPAMSSRSPLGVGAPLCFGPLSSSFPSPLVGCRQLEVRVDGTLQRSLLSVRLVSAPLRRMPSLSLLLRSQGPGSPSLCASPLALVADPAHASSPAPSPLASLPLLAFGSSSPLSSPPGPSPLPARAPCGPAPVAARLAGALSGGVGGEVGWGVVALLRAALATACSSRTVTTPSLLRILDNLPQRARVFSWIRFKAPRRCRRSASP